MKLSTTILLAIMGLCAWAAPLSTSNAVSIAAADVDDNIVYPEFNSDDDNIVYPEFDRDSEIVYPDAYTDV
ncbi:hypothetical protein N7G274_010244 [Stereocaulon virgatum]|uniref:Uncharacterized protein n=1 Tax=Stereocaulon virgatum TaxID=373712 RepID=A0ABR3ZTV1_9LECA